MKMGKRTNSTSQMSKDEVEEVHENSSITPTGKFDSASSDQLKRRRILRVSDKWSVKKKGENAALSTNPVMNVNPLQKVSFGTTNSNPNPFASTKPKTVPPPTSNVGKTQDPSPVTKNPFAKITFAPTPASMPITPIKPMTTAPTTNKFNLTPHPAKDPSKSKGVFAPSFPSNQSKGKEDQNGEYFPLAPVPEISQKTVVKLSDADKLNLAFLRRLQQNMRVNPLGDWSTSVKAYIRRAEEIESKFQKDILNDIGNNKKSSSSEEKKPFLSSTFSFGQSNNTIGSTSITTGSSSNAKSGTPAFNFSSTSTTTSSTGADKGSSSTGFSFSFPKQTHDNTLSIPTKEPTTASTTSSTTLGNEDNTNDDAGPKDDEEVEKENNTEETTLFECRAKYSNLDDDNNWVSHAAGVLRLYQHNVTSKCRIVIRNSVGKVQFNVSLSKKQKFVKINGKKNKGHIQFIGVRDSDVGVEKLMITVGSDTLDKLFTHLENSAK
mmetsp:Transcript_9015/g.12827  ORF Transcript_9015/g.12827 Transcript_9015/m.12827 type:complete len:492 (-) Transcript_9015:163-1638(-)